VDFASSPALRVGTPKALFHMPLGFGPWDVTADGKRFLVAAPAGNTAVPITVLVDWQARLGR
jgi:hypothetical protein